MKRGGHRRKSKPLRRLRHAATIPALEAARCFARLLTHRGALRVGAALGAVACLVARRERRRAERQLLDAGVATTRADARRLARDVFRHLGMNMIEWLHSMGWSRRRIQTRVRLEGREHLRAAAEGGRGLLFVSAHLGNWELMPRAYEALTGEPLAVVMTEQQHARLNEWIVRHRRDSCVEVLPNSRSGVGLLRHLLKGGRLGLMGDQDSRRTAGIFVAFFGRPALTPSGPALLARRTGSPIVPITITRDRADPTRHCFRVGAPIRPDPSLDDEADIRRMTESFTRQLECRIRESPAQWVWLHARWKHQPDPPPSPHRS